MQTELLAVNVDTLLGHYLKQGIDLRSAKLAAIAKYNNDPTIFDFAELDRILAIWQKPCTSLPNSPLPKTVAAPINTRRTKIPHAYRIKQLEMYLKNE
jgi:hypothetical protein